MHFTKDEKMWTRHESHTTFVLPMLPSDYCFCLLALNAMICQWTPTIVFQGVDARCSLSRASSSFFPRPQKRCWSCQTFGCKLTQQTMAYSFSLLAYLIPIPQRKTTEGLKCMKIGILLQIEENDGTKERHANVSFQFIFN